MRLALQQKVQWVATSIDAASLQYSLCSAADAMLSSESASMLFLLAKSQECLHINGIESLTEKVRRSFK